MHYLKNIYFGGNYPFLFGSVQQLVCGPPHSVVKMILVVFFFFFCSLLKPPTSYPALVQKQLEEVLPDNESCLPLLVCLAPHHSHSPLHISSHSFHPSLLSV